MDKNYKSIIFTDHALERLSSRSISQEMVYQAITKPTKSSRSKESTKFVKKINGRTVHVVAQFLSDARKWLIISVWVRGEDDKAPLAWRIITFPFWLLWKGMVWLLKQLFYAKTA